MIFATMRDAFAQIGAHFSFAPFSSLFQPLVDDVLAEQGKDRCRAGTILSPTLLVWLVLASRNDCALTEAIVSEVRNQELFPADSHWFE